MQLKTIRTILFALLAFSSGVFVGICWRLSYHSTMMTPRREQGARDTQKISSTLRHLTQPRSVVTRQCAPQSNIMFLKTHKTASTAVQNILLRYADKNKLTVGLSQTYDIRFHYGKKFQEEYVAKSKTPINILCHHMVFNEPEVRKVMPANSIYVTILREPTALYESMFDYFHYDSTPFSRVKRDQLEFWLDHTDIFFKGRKDGRFPWFAKNGVFFDMGYDNLSEDDTYIPDMAGNVSQIVGGPTQGFVDGEFEIARFSSPQGVCWYGGNTLFVADCNNHAVRKIDLLVKRVITVCGTGVQGNDLQGGNQGLDQPIDSPWDVTIGGSPRVPGGRSLLYIAMSGCHQIWTLALEKTDFQKGSEIDMCTCIRYAGNGKEENRNNVYPHKAGFAQPSGLSHCESEHALYIADSESSTIRKMLLKNGAVQGLVGGDIDPTNLFAYGDVDGIGRNAKLQHPIGVQWDSVRNVLYVADTYNHKIKIIDPKKKSCVTMDGLKDKNGSSLFSEPSGITIDPACKFLYVADTNNHEIKVISLDDYVMKKLPLKLNVDAASHEMTPSQVKLLTGEKTTPKLLNVQPCSLQQNIIISISYGDFHLNEEPLSSWQVSCENSEEGQFHLISSGYFSDETPTSVTIKLSDIVKKTHLCNNEYIVGDVVKVYVESIVYYCVGDACKMLRYKAVVPFEIIFEESPSSQLPIQIVIS